MEPAAEEQWGGPGAGPGGSAGSLARTGSSRIPHSLPVAWLAGRHCLGTEPLQISLLILKGGLLEVRDQKCTSHPHTAGALRDCAEWMHL